MTTANVHHQAETMLGRTSAGSILRARFAVELEYIRSDHGGILQAQDVVDFARDPAAALHHCFQWDDGLAADQYRLWQARQVIRVTVDVITSEAEPIRAYVSLLHDRLQPGGGYRARVDVLSNREQHKRMLLEALAEYTRAGAKYTRIKELKPIRRAIERVRRAATRKKGST